MPEPLLEVRDLHAWYGESHILHGVGFEIMPGETVTLLGRNGAGKTTTLKSIMGIVARRRGSVRLGGRELIDLPSNRIARLGLAFCPEERGIFASLTVEENLRLPPVVQPGGLGVDAIYELFPNLRERLRAGGTTLSGGEQQMLAIGRCLMGAPELVMFDEPSLGLAPTVVQALLRCIRDLNRDGLTCVLVEQNVAVSLKLANHAYVLENGRIALSGAGEALLGDDRVREAYLGL